LHLLKHVNSDLAGRIQDSWDTYLINVLSGRWRETVQQEEPDRFQIPLWDRVSFARSIPGDASIGSDWLIER